MAGKKTRKRSATAATAATALAPAPSSCAWTLDEEKELLDYLISRKSQQAEGSFRKAIFTEAAGHIAPHRVKGAVKTGSACQDKYRQLKKKFEGVRAIKGYSGLEYSEAKGANIGPSTEHIWAALLAVEPRIQPFKNKGWNEDLYDKMHALVAGKPKGSFVFNGATAEPEAPAEDGDLSTPTSTPGPDAPPTSTEDEEPPASADGQSEDLDSGVPESLSDDRPCTPPPLSRSALSTSTTSVVMKRPHRALISDSVSAASESKRTRLTPMSKSVMGFGEDFKSFNELMHTVLKPEISSGLDATPKRKTRAMERAQTLEGSWLDDQNLIRLLQVFESDSNAADAYLTLKKDTLRQAWVQNRLNLDNML